VDADKTKGVAAALSASLSAACFLLPWKAATTYGKPELLVLVLLSSAALFNTLAGALQRRRAGAVELPLAPTLAVAAGLAVLTLLGNLASAEAIHRISGPLLAVLQRCEVILVALLGWFVLRERVRMSFWVGAAVAALGLVLFNPPGAQPVEGGFDPVGALFGLASALCFGSMIVLTRRYIMRLRLLLLNTVRLWMSVALWFAVHRRVPDMSEFPPELLGLGALAAFFGPFLSRMSAIVSSRFVPANLTVLASLATPPLTLALAFLVLGTLPTRSELLGGVIMLTGISIPVVAALRSQ
jgi:drug/metabolite transporter (DMT)-like permease